MFSKKIHGHQDLSAKDVFFLTFFLYLVNIFLIHRFLDETYLMDIELFFPLTYNGTNGKSDAILISHPLFPEDCFWSHWNMFYDCLLMQRILKFHNSRLWYLPFLIFPVICEVLWYVLCLEIRVTLSLWQFIPTNDPSSFFSGSLKVWNIWI